jgi:hypothetical protein
LNRDEFQQLADVRIAEAKVLLDGQIFDGAYYLAGYAIECAFKACIAKLTNQFDFPPKLDEVRRIYVHKPKELARAAGLLDDLEAESQNDRSLFDNWAAVSAWGEESRYQRKTEAQARELYEAITEGSHGVLQWIKVRW